MIERIANKPKVWNILEANRQLKPHGVRIAFFREDNEYQVSLAGQPDATYFTDDREDALDTAMRMAGLDKKATRK